MQEGLPDSYYDELDHIVDTRNVSYDDARRILGVEPVGPAELPAATDETDGTIASQAEPAARTTTSLDRSRRARAAMGPQYGEEAGVGYPGGLPPEHQPRIVLSEEQLAINQRGLAAARAALANARKVE